MRTISFLILAILLSCSTNADVVRVAVASNFRNPMIDIARQFESNGEHTLVVSYGASGKLFAQIINGAPFDVFLSADQEKPQRLIDRRLAIADTRMTYAYGQLILWSAQSSEQSLRDFLVTSEGRIAMANPRLAPYGQAALETLRTLSLIEQTQDRWVMGENIAQTFHFVHSGNATAGFIANSQSQDASGSTRGTTWPIPTDLHKPIAQDAVLLSQAQNSIGAQSLIQFLNTTPVARIIHAHGYFTHQEAPGMGYDREQHVSRDSQEAIDIE